MKYYMAGLVSITLTIIVLLVDFTIGRAPGGEILLSFLPLFCVCGYDVLHDWFADLPELLTTPSVSKVKRMLPSDFKVAPHTAKEYFDFELGTMVPAPKQHLKIE